MSSESPALEFNLDRAWSYKISVLADLVSRQVSDAVGRVSDLNLSQWRVIAAIADQPGRTASQVVALTPMDKAIVSRAVSGLVSRNYLQRRASETDGRLSHLFLTEAGDQAYTTILKELRGTGADGIDLLDGNANNQFLADLDALIERYRNTIAPDR